MCFAPRYDGRMSQTLSDSQIALLAAMLASPRALNAAELSRATGLAPPVVSEAVAALQRHGCRIDAHPQRGFALRRTGLECWADFIETRHATALGRRVWVYRHTASTQDIARQLVDGAADLGAVCGTLVVADHQTAGRGRLGRRWLSRPGGQLLLTAIVRHEQPIVDRLMLASAHAVAQVAEAFADGAVGVRWPNDVMLDGRKLAGILVERVGGAALLGVGFNVALDPDDLPPELAPTVTSLAHAGHAADRLAVLDVLLRELDLALRLGDDQLVSAWRGRNTLTQRRITVETDGKTLTGRVIDIDPARGLLLAVEGGPVAPLPAATTSLVPDRSPRPV